MQSVFFQYSFPKTANNTSDKKQGGIPMKHFAPVAALVCVLALLLSATALAYETGTEYCFADSDFSTNECLEGIFLAEVPAKADGSLYLGSRLLRAGDVVPAELLSSLRLISQDETPGEATMVFFAVSEGHALEPTALKIPIGKKKNEPPTAADSTFETYRNIANTGKLSVTDPEGETFTVNLVKEPKRGTVTFEQDGTFTYTPMENKLGKDSFVYTVTDPAGNTSGEATVTVQILKPTVKPTYADMNGDSGHFAAVWLREKGLFCGEQVAEMSCFQPDKTVTRGEFLSMTMKLLGAEAETEQVSTGFADEKDTPKWLQPYLVTALKTGMISGVTSESGMVFRPTAALTKAEAAVMLQNALGLPQPEDAPVFADADAAPAWAQSSFEALSCAGIDLSPTLSAEAMTRRDAAMLLYQVSTLVDTGETVFPWSA